LDGADKAEVNMMFVAHIIKSYFPGSILEKLMKSLFSRNQYCLWSLLLNMIWSGSRRQRPSLAVFTQSQHRTSKEIWQVGWVFDSGAIKTACWEKWHGWRTDAQRISHVLEMSHLNATSKSQAGNKQDSLSLLSTNLLRQQ
jgi:hypothetical protein